MLKTAWDGHREPTYQISTHSYNGAERTRNLYTNSPRAYSISSAYLCFGCDFFKSLKGSAILFYMFNDDVMTRGLHGADFQSQFQSTPFSWIQIHSTPSSKINGASIPIHMKVRSVLTCIVLKYKQCLCLMPQIWHIFFNHCCILGI